MSNVIDQKIIAFDELASRKYPVLRLLTFQHALSATAGAPIEYSCSIVMCKDSTFQGEYLRLELMGVRGFKFVQPNWSEVYIPYIKIKSNEAGIGIEHRFVVLDAEQEEVFWMTCRDFEVFVLI
jgi:hypothetical protein